MNWYNLQVFLQNVGTAQAIEVPYALFLKLFLEKDKKYVSLKNKKAIQLYVKNI